jgi:hypothetical protein
MARRPYRARTELSEQAIRPFSDTAGTAVLRFFAHFTDDPKERWGVMLLLGGWLVAGSLPARADSVVAKFALNSSTAGVAIQFDVAPLAAGVSLTAPTLENAAPHGVDSNLLDSGATRFLVYSTTNVPLNPDGVVSVSLGVTGLSLLADGMLRVENVIVSDAGGQVVAGLPDAKPVILSVSPNAYRSVLVGSHLPLSVQAIDPDGVVTSVTFRIDGISHGVANARPYACDWAPLVSGLHIVDVEVSDGGNIVTSKPVELRAYGEAEISSFAQFAGIHFGPDGGNPAIAGPTASPAGNGLPNQLAFFHGINPWSPDHAALPQISRDASGKLVFRFRRSTLATGSDYVILTSSTLLPASWLPLTGVPVTITDLGNGLQELSITVPTTEDRQFFRLQVTQAEPLKT